MANLTREQALEVKKRHADGETQTALAREFGVSQSAVSSIIRGRTHANPVRVAMTREEELQRRREQRFVKVYGITHEEWLLMLEAAGYACEACGASVDTQHLHPVRGTPSLVCDHDHATGKVRGVLCHNCNLALGHLADSEERIMKLLNYLRSGRKF